MKLKIAQVIGLNTDQKAAQVTSAARDGNNFIALLELTCDDAFTKGRQALSELEDFFFEFEGSVAEKLNATFAAAEEKFTAGGDFNICLAAISGKVLYLIGKGSVEVYLKRADTLSPLLSVGAPSQLISGFLQEGDKLLFSTSSLTSLLGQDLGKSLNLPIDTFEEEVEGKIGASGLENPMAALAAELGEESVEIPTFIPQDEAPVEKPVEQYYSPRAKIAFGEILGKVLFSVLGVRRYFPKSGRGRLAVAVILIIILAVGAGYQYKLSRDQKIKAQFNQAMQEAKDNFNAAVGLASLSPTEAKNKLDLAKDQVNKALALKPNEAEAQNLKKQIETQEPSILQQSSVSDFPVFLDIDLVKKNFRATQMSLSKGKLLLMDPGVKTLVMVDLAKKSNQILAGSEGLGDASLFSLNGALAFVHSKDKGIIRIDSSNSKLATVAKKDDDLGEIKDIYGFAGNIYLLDAGKNQIWKYLPAAGGYSDKREYLTKGTQADFSGALRMQIESSVYVLKSGGEILRFTKGDKDNFSYSGLPSGVKEPKSIFTSSDTDNLYILDSGNSRILIVTKTGSYKGQITGNMFATATDLVVDEVGKKVYLLDGSKIYSVDLK